MQINDTTLAWAAEKLSQFYGWRGYPETAQDLKGRVRAFLRLVHDKTVREILDASCQPGQAITYKIDPDMNDADWILDLIAETMDYFPLPAQMREIYTAKLPPASNFGEPTCVRRADTEEAVI